MSYLVIARKWRPTLFGEIVGQEHVTKTLENAISSERIAHAYLFSGPRGVGKTTAARIFAKSINCVKGPLPDPCNECPICLSITAGSSVDIIEIDGASNTGVDNVRELRESLRFVPTTSRYKVYIIDEVHMLSTAAFNALLKTLEEPPPNTVFIFATTEVHKIPRTILSRCQRFDFRRIPFTQISDKLKQIAVADGINAPDRVFELLAREGDGSLRDAESLLDQALSYSGDEITEADVIEALGLMDRSILLDLSHSLLGGDGKACLNIVEKVYNFGYDLKKVCLELLEHIRDITVLKATGEAALLELPVSEIEKLREISEKVGIDRLHMLFAIVSKGYEDISRSVTPRFTIEMMLLRGSNVEDLRPIGELLGEVRSMADRVDFSGAQARPSVVRGPSAGYDGGGRSGPSGGGGGGQSGSSGSSGPDRERAENASPVERSKLPWENGPAQGARPQADRAQRGTRPPIEAGPPVDARPPRQPERDARPVDRPPVPEPVKEPTPDGIVESRTEPAAIPEANLSKERPIPPGTFQDFLKERDAILYGQMSGASFERKGDTLEVSTEKSDSIKTLLKMKESVLKALISEYFLENLKVLVVSQEAVDNSGSHAGLVQEAVKIFEGKVVEDKGGI